MTQLQKLSKSRNSRLTNCRLIFRYPWLWIDRSRKNGSLSLDTKIAIKDTIIENCSESHDNYSRSFIRFDSFRNLKDTWDFYDLVNITLENVNVTDNNSPFFAPPNFKYNILCVFIIFTGHTNFTRNEGTIIEMPPCVHHYSANKILFSTADVYITNNRAALHTSPFIIENGPVMFEHCHVVFSSNHGTSSGGIEMFYGTKMMFNDDMFLEFSNNVGQKGGALYLRSNLTMIL